MLSRKLLVLIGVGWLVIGGFTTLVQMMAGNSGKFDNFENFFVIAALAIISFAMADLAPHLQRKDERIQFIRQKGALYTSVLALAYCGGLWLLIRYGFLDIDVKQAVLILLSLIASTLFISWVVLSRKH
jgi:drug/metabolite transporter (DMT)-like permease